jgi:uncharacterized phage protein (TIGR02218 family)
VLAFTTHDQSLVIEGETYVPSPGMQALAIQTQGNTAVDNTDIHGWLDDAAITTEDLDDGLWDYADIRFFQVNWQDLSAGRLTLRGGWIGEVRRAGPGYVAEVRGRMQALVREIGDLYAPDCQADLGDSRCKVDLSARTVTGSVTALGDQRTFFDSSRGEAPHWFDVGVLTWTSGLNNGRHMEIEYYSGSDTSPQGAFVLFLPMHRAIAIGDTYAVYPGCAKTLDNCINKFNNLDNYRGYPYAPGNDQLLLYPDSHV